MTDYTPPTLTRYVPPALTPEAVSFVRRLFAVPDHVALPADARFYVKAQMELYPERGHENWCPLPGREVDQWGDVDGDLEPSDWVGEEQMVHPVGVDHYNCTAEEVWRWCQANLLDDPASWSTENGGMLMGDGLHLMAHAVDLDGMDWNVGGRTPVFAADAAIAVAS